MFVNRLFADRFNAKQPRLGKSAAPEVVHALHEAFEISLCDEGMCFVSVTPHEVGTVLSVNFDPDAGDNAEMLQSEGVVVECIPIEHESEGYQITMLFTGN